MLSGSSRGSTEGTCNDNEAQEGAAGLELQEGGMAHLRPWVSSSLRCSLALKFLAIAILAGSSE